jgi:hypothetical protein
MFNATLTPAANRNDSGALSLCAQPRAKLACGNPPTCSVKRSVLAMSMRFSYDAATTRAVIN